MTCDCADPIVFGHHCGNPSYNPGETFTITGGELTYTIGGTNRTIPLAGGQMSWGPAVTVQNHAIGLQAVQNLPYPPETPWNWLEAAQTAQNLLELRPTPQTFTNAPQTAPEATQDET